MVKNKKGQSTLEYIILVTAVIVIVIGFLMSSSSPFRTQLNSIFMSTQNSMNTMSVRLANSI